MVAAPSGVGLFRQEALAHHLEAGQGRGLLQVSPPWTWALLVILVSGIGLALVASFVGHVEVNGRGRGILRPVGGVRLLTAQVSGAVSRVEAQTGESVQAGATLLRIDAASIQAQILEAERQWEAVDALHRTLGEQQARNYDDQVERVRARISNLDQQVESQRGSIRLQEQKLEADRSLVEKGFLSSIALGEAGEALEQARRQARVAVSALEQARQELAALESRRQDELWQRQQVLTSAQARKDSLALLLKQTTVQAPEAGVLEAVLVKAGDTIQVGQPVGKLVPLGSPLHVVSFLAERDRAFVKPGDEVHLELDQLPYAEYGTLRARVRRISDDLASPYEIREALGEDQRLDAPTWRVELDVIDEAAASSAHVRLRPGMMMNVRYTLRRQPLITLLLEPLRRWVR